MFKAQVEFAPYFYLQAKVQPPSSPQAGCVLGHWAMCCLLTTTVTEYGRICTTTLPREWR